MSMATLRSQSMLSMSSVPLFLLQAGTRADTVITRMIPERGVLDWTSVVLQLVVLLLGIASLITLVVLLITVRKGVERVNTLLTQFTTDSRPLIAKATEVVTDAREVVAMLRTDAERVTDAAGAISEQLLDAADVTARRVDDVNAVLDVLQQELEDTALSTFAAVRGARHGASVFGERIRKRRDRSDGRLSKDDRSSDERIAEARGAAERPHLAREAKSAKQ